jgi:hypothetical protein
MCRRRANDPDDNQAGFFAIADVLAGMGLQLKWLGVGDAATSMGRSNSLLFTWEKELIGSAVRSPIWSTRDDCALVTA